MAFFFRTNRSISSSNDPNSLFSTKDNLVLFGGVDSNNPFYNQYSNELKRAKQAFEEDHEHEPSLYEIDDEEKRIDKDFHPDDI